MKKIYWGLLSLLFVGCGAMGETSGPIEVQRKAIGHLRAIYPIPDGLGGYYLELQFTGDTLNVNLMDFQAWTADSLGKAEMRTRATDLRLRGGNCLFSLGKLDCLDVY